MTDLKYQYTFEPDAENNTAASIARMVLDGGQDVLDIGSGPAWVSRYLAAEHGRRVTCVDNDPAALASLSDVGVRAVAGDLESPDWHRDLAGTSYDVVILADVLEHLRDPGDVLAALTTEGLLRPDGFLVVSVPNASHQAVIAELAIGDMRYTETGILDETHVRWFTRIALERLLEKSGFVLDRVERTRRTLEQTPTGERAALLSPALRRELLELNPDSETYQFVVRARPCGEAGRLVVLREQAEDAERRFARASQQAAALRAQVAAEQDRRQQESARSAERVEQLRGRVGRLKAQVERLRAEADRPGREPDREPGPRGRARARGVARRLRRG